MGLGLSIAGAGCAPAGQGDPCTPEAIPANGFVSNEVYVETSSVQCRTRVCMVYHLTGNPDCTSGDPDVDCANATVGGQPNACVFYDALATPAPVTRSLCIEADDPMAVQIDPISPDRVFCTCRCSAGGNSALPLCQCTEGFRCVPDSDPGGGYCVPSDLAIHEGICINDSECATIGSSLSCDASHHCR